MNRCISLLIILGLLLAPTVAIAQRGGTVEGRVIDAKTGAALGGANVLLKGTPYGAATNALGQYVIWNVPVGDYEIEASYIGYEAVTDQLSVAAGLKVMSDFALESTVLEGAGVVVTANRALARETPIAFTDIGRDRMDKLYTTQDVPDLIRGVPGVFTATTGLGEGDLHIRGFDSERVQILINGIPVNDPESQVVYWSNWTGLSSAATSIQVQRGAGSSLYGSGAFGGSLNIETMGVSSRPGLTLRTSAGLFTTHGAEGGEHDGEIADGEGGFESYTPLNYMLSLRYNSGLVHGGKLMYSASAERKGGDSYNNGTTYDGWSFGFDAKGILSNHILTFSFIGAPQDHYQSTPMQDMALLDELGWEYNRFNHPYQENYYFKPQFSLRHDWLMTEKSSLSTNYFLTFGRGGGRYLRNDDFDVETGEVGFKDLSGADDNKYFGRNALYIYDVTGGDVVLTGFNPADTTFTSDGTTTEVSRAAPLIADTYAHSWKNDSKNHHTQFGLNTVYRHELSPMATVFVGGEARRWKADHFAESFNFRSSDAAGGLIEYDEVQRRYDYSTTVTNLSGFARVGVRPVERLNVVADAQFAQYKSKVEENAIQIFDFEAGEFVDAHFKVTEDLRNADGTPVFTDEDYERTYEFFSPKFGANYNLTDELNVLANYSIAYKEPKARDWYDRANGPTEEDLDAEKATNYEFGVGYQTDELGVNVNYYILDFEDKIESVLDQADNYVTTNAGKARHQGLEVAASAVRGPFDASGSLTWARNRWQEMNLKELFDEPAEDIVDKVVPFSPERMASAAVGYTTGPLRVGLSTNWWDEYYGSYTNEYTLVDGTVVEAKLDPFFELNADVTYNLRLADRDVRLRLDLNNLTNRQNFARANWETDYNRDDDLLGVPYMYVATAPLFNVFLTAEINF